MKNLEELAHLVVIRNHLSDLLNGTRNVIKKGEVGQISALLQKLDSEIIQNSLELFKGKAVVTDEDDIAKKVAEAKAKMLLPKKATVPAAVLNVKPLASEPEAQLVEPVKTTKRTFKRVNKDESGSV